jgi:phenylpropionate dioxygenase-like ring-hydroxylating dioxygenase large terminal subunit
MDISKLVVEDAEAGTFRIHRSTMTSSEIMELEKTRIFDRSWLYVGHGSEIPSAGDFRRRVVAGRPLFMIRSEDGKVRIFFNTCRHRGALVCRQDAGNSKSFQCFYHGWIYNDRGELTGVPDLPGYAGGLDESKHGLKQPPHVDSVHELYFVNFDPDAPPLLDYIGEEAKEILDMSMESADLLGGWKVIKGSAKYNIRANWKLLLENSVDNYHYRPIHQSYLDFRSERREGGDRGAVARGNPRGVALKNGHVAMLTPAPGRTIANPASRWDPKVIEEVNRIRGELAKRYGEKRGHMMADVSRFLIIFPNVAVHDTQSGFKIRQWWPVSPGVMEVNQWEMVPNEERDDVRAARMEGAITFQGPGGFGTPDDIEGMESCQAGFAAREVEWSDASRGMRREARDDDELTSRGFWRHWISVMSGGTGAERVGDPPFVDRAEKVRAS